MKKIIVLAVVLLLFTLTPYQIISESINEEESNSDITKNEDKAESKSLSYSRILTALDIFKLNKKETSKLNNNLKNENQQTKNVFNYIIEPNSESIFPKKINIGKTDDTVEELINREDNSFFETETWGWYKERLGWILEASEVIHEFINKSVQLLYNLSQLPGQVLDLFKNLFNESIAKLNHIKWLWKQGIFNLTVFNLDNLKTLISMSKEEIIDKINDLKQNLQDKFNEISEFIKERFEDLKKQLDENITALKLWFESEPWNKPIQLVCHIKNPEAVGMKISWSYIGFSDQGNKTIPGGGVVNEDNEIIYKINFDTSDPQLKQYLFHLIQVIIEKTNGDYEIRYCWAFSNASVNLNFFSGDDDNARPTNRLFDRIFLKNSLLFRFLSNFRFFEKVLF